MHDNLEPMANGPETTGVSVHSGFPNPAANSRNRQGGLALDLNQLLIQHPSSTFLFRIRGHTWADQGVFDGDIAIIDRAIAAQSHDLVIAWEEDNFTVQRRKNLTSETMWGVVTAVIHPRATEES